MKTKQEKIIWKQKHEREEGFLGKKRKKKFLYLKHVGQLGDYYNQKRGIKTEEETLKTSDGFGVPSLNFYQRIKLRTSSLFSFLLLKCKRLTVIFAGQK